MAVSTAPGDVPKQRQDSRLRRRLLRCLLYSLVRGTGNIGDGKGDIPKYTKFKKSCRTIPCNSQPVTGDPSLKQ